MELHHTNKKGWGLFPITSLLPCQGAVVGIDVVGENDIDKLLGPNKKQARQNASRGGGTAAISQPEEERSAWDDAPIDMEAPVDNETTTRYDIFRTYVTIASVRFSIQSM